MRLGLFGGTFDPVHFGHLAVVGTAKKAFQLSQVLLIPAAQSPLRDVAHAPAHHRLEMCRLAVRDHAGIAVTDIELTRNRPSYTADTLGTIQRQYPRDELFVLIGADTLNGLLCWRDIGRIVDVATFISITRPGYRNTPPAKLLATVPRARFRIHSHEMPEVDISSSRVRALIAAGHSLDACLPPQVQAYIRKHDLYTSTTLSSSSSI